MTIGNKPGGPTTDDSVGAVAVAPAVKDSPYRVLAKVDGLPDIARIAPAIATAAAAAYAVGLLEVNAYLARYGVSDFDLLRPRYIAIGGFGLLIMAVSAVLPAVAYWNITDAFARKSEAKSIIVLANLFLAISPAFALVVLLHLSVSGAIWTEVAGSLTALAASLAIIPWISADGSAFHVSGFKYSTPRWVGGGLGLIIFLIAFAVFIGIMAQDVLPIVPDEIGGLRPTTVSIVLRPADVAALRSTGMDLSPNGISQGPVQLLYESSNFVLIEVRDRRFVRLDQNEVIAWSSR